jgi:hypothetical protein
LKEIREAPRSALWRELCELHLESGECRRAEELAKDWFLATNDGEAQLYRAQARAEVFFTDRRRDDGRYAFDLVKEAEDLLEGDPRPMRLRLKLASSCGAWKEARRVLVRLLEASPGDPALEGRFRRILSLSESSPTLDQALREVERTGLLVDEDPVEEVQSASVAVRPVLKDLVTLDGVKMAAYVRGGTCLVQGPKGATADRTARSLRELVQTSRTAGRRLGLGQTLNVYLEGDFGHLVISPGEQGAGALWSTDPIRGRALETLRELAGIKNASTEVDE